MTEKEKMLKGLLYNANYDEQLLNERFKAKDLCFDYNNIKPSDKVERDNIIKNLFGSTKQNFEIVQPFYCDYGYNIHIGENFFANHNVVMLDCANIIFGDNVFIAPNCAFYTAGHPIDFKQRNIGLEYAYPIKVGNNVWFGGGVTVLPNVTIGDNTIIAAGSLVNKNIPSNVIAAGNPCKVIREITEEDKKKYNI